MRIEEARSAARSGLSKWCLSCGKWMFRCQCREPLAYFEAADVIDMERRPVPTHRVNDGQRVRIGG